MIFLFRKKLFISIGIFLTLTSDALAQYNEAGILLGASNYKGELSEHLFNTNFLHFSGGVFFRHNWNRHWSYQFEFNYGKISGDDAFASSGFARKRSLS